MVSALLVVALVGVTMGLMVWARRARQGRASSPVETAPPSPALYVANRLTHAQVISQVRETLRFKEYLQHPSAYYMGGGGWRVEGANESGWDVVEDGSEVRVLPLNYAARVAMR